MRRLLTILAAFLLLAHSAVVSALSVTPVDAETVAVLIEASGKTKAEAEAEAKRQAVTATAGRVLLDNRLVRASALLEKYLGNYSGNFVNAIETLSEQFAGGETQISARVFINYRALVADLEEKRFLYEPAFKPVFSLFIAESLDGEKIPQEVTRPLMETSLTNLGLKPYTGPAFEPAGNIDLQTSGDLMAQALVAAERRNVEIIVTGNSTIILQEQKPIYYDRFFFYTCDTEVRMVRVDTGEVLFTATASGSASSRDQAEAVSLSVQRASDAAAADLMNQYTEFWPQVIQGRARYEILLTGTNDELNRVVTQHIGNMGQNTEIHLKKTFGTSAVLSINSQASFERLIETLRACPYPTLTIIRTIGERKAEAQVSG